MNKDLMWAGQVFALVAADPASADSLAALVAATYDAAPFNLFQPVALAK